MNSFFQDVFIKFYFLEREPLILLENIFPLKKYKTLHPQINKMNFRYK